MEFPNLKFSVDTHGIATITLDVAGKPMNVFGKPLLGDLTPAIERVISDASIRGVILTSAKADFMAGADIKEMIAFFDSLDDEQRVYREVARPANDLFRRMETCGKPFVAAINGPALGGGLELTLACHYRIVSDDPKLILSLPEVGIGLIPGGGGTQRLPRLIGVQPAVQAMLLGTRFTPAEALKAGFVNLVVPREQLLAAASGWLMNAPDAVQPWDKKDYKVPGGVGRAEGLPQFFNLSATKIANQTQHNNPAPIGLLNAVARGTLVPFDAGSRIESRIFTKLLMNPVALNMMRTLFVSKGQCEKLAARPAGIAVAKLSKIGVVGAGLMGAGVAQVSAQAGLDVILIDATAEQAAAGKQRLAESLGKLVAKGKMKADQLEALLARITPTTDYSDLADCGLVVEAVFENRKIKAEVFAKARAVMRPDAILASNTSSLPITSLAEGASQPERFIGLHFFSPVDRMPLIEVIRGEQTSDATLAHALDYVKLLRKTPIVVKDSPGFFTTRVIGAYLNEAMGMLKEGLPPALIDNAAKQAGFPVGPLAMLDELSIELGYHAARQYRDDAGADWIEGYGFSVQQKFCEELNRKGRRYGSGFYDYTVGTGDGQRRVWKDIGLHFPPAQQPPSVEELKSRMLLIQALEAAKAFEEGVISDAGEADVGAILGIGFPTYTGGPFSYIDTLGIKVFVARCDALAKKHGGRYRPSAWLRERASSSIPFYPKPAAAHEL